MPAILTPARQRISYTANGVDAFSLFSTLVYFGNVTAAQTTSDKIITLASANGFAFGLNGALFD